MICDVQVNDDFSTDAVTDMAKQYVKEKEAAKSPSGK